MILGNEKALWLLFIVPAVVGPLYFWGFWRKREGLRKLAEAGLLARINSRVSVGRQVFRAVLLCAGIVSIVVGLCEPKWNPHPKEVQSRGRDVVILLDVSRSMLAEDIRPSRLERAKIAIRDLMETLGGDRIGVVTFAGNSEVKCPLTQDYAFVRMALADISTESTSRGGTMIGDAIRKAVKEVFDETSEGYKDIVLITDGEDHDSFPVEAAEDAGREGVRIIAIAIGDQKDGARIPVYDENGRKSFLRYEGEEVWSKVKGGMLNEIARASKDGRYLAVGPGTTFDLGGIYSNLIASAEKRELESVSMMEYDERFQVFLALGLLFVVWEFFTSERKKV